MRPRDINVSLGQFREEPQQSLDSNGSLLYTPFDEDCTVKIIESVHEMPFRVTSNTSTIQMT